MIIKYTKKTSGYIALVLSIVTLKIFIEAFLLGRGPVPGLSFLLYTMIFYTHYNLEKVETHSYRFYNRLIILVEILKENNLEELLTIDNINLGKEKLSEKITNAVNPLIEAMSRKYEKTQVYLKKGYHKKLPLVLDATLKFTTLIKKYTKMIHFKIKSSQDYLKPRFKQIKNVSVKEGLILRHNLFEMYGNLHKKWMNFMSNTLD